MQLAAQNYLWMLLPQLIMADAYWVYILKCADNSLYIGITTSIERRLFEHNLTEKAAKYTRSRRPVELVFIESQKDRSAASKRERALKKLSRERKQRLILEYQANSHILASRCEVTLYDYTVR